MATWSLSAVGRVRGGRGIRGVRNAGGIGTGPVPGVPPPPEKAVPWREHAYPFDEVKDK